MDYLLLPSPERCKRESTLSSPGRGVGEEERGQEAGRGWERGTGPLRTLPHLPPPAKKSGQVRSRVRPSAGSTGRGVSPGEVAPAECFEDARLQVWGRRRSPSGLSRPPPRPPALPSAAASRSEQPGRRPAPGAPRRSPPRCAWTGTSSAGGPSSAGSPSAGAGCGPAPAAPRPRGCRCPWQRPTEGARRRRGRGRGRRPPGRTRCPRQESRARGCRPHAAGPRPALGTEGGRTVAERRPGKDAPAAAAADTAAAASELTPN